MSIGMMRRCVGGLSLAVFAAAGCDSHAPPDYQGEALATLTGEVRLERDSLPPSNEIELLYQNYTVHVSREDQVPPDMQFTIVESLPVTGDYPAAFTLDLFEAPPEEALTDFTVGGDANERRVGLAIIASSYDCDEAHVGPSRCVFGGAGRMALVWAEEEILPDTRTATFVGTTLDAGYHLVEYIPNFATEEEHSECLRDVVEMGTAGEICPRWVAAGEVPLDTSLSVRLVEGTDSIFFHGGGASLRTVGGLELVDWFDSLDRIDPIE